MSNASEAVQRARVFMVRIFMVHLRATCVPMLSLGPLLSIELFLSASWTFRDELSSTTGVSVFDE